MQRPIQDGAALSILLYPGRFKAGTPYYYKAFALKKQSVIKRGMVLSQVFKENGEKCLAFILHDPLIDLRGVVKGALAKQIHH